MNLKFKGILRTVCALALCFAVTPAFAATTETKTGPAVKAVVQSAKIDVETLRADIAKKGETVRQLEAKKVAALKMISANKKDAKRIELEQKTLNYANDGRNRLARAISDLEKITTIIETRIAALKTEAKDTTAAEQAVALAKTNIQAAKDHITALTDTQNKTVNAEKLVDGMSIVGTALIDIETSLKAARQNLLDAFNLIKLTAPVTSATAPATR